MHTTIMYLKFIGCSKNVVNENGPTYANKILVTCELKKKILSLCRECYWLIKMLLKNKLIDYITPTVAIEMGVNLGYW